MKPEGRSTVAAWATLGLILAVGLGLRAYHLDDRPLTFDEAWSWRVVQFPAAEMFDRLARDVHPPLFYCLLRGWVAAFGDSAVALRSLSVAFGLVTVVGLYLFVADGFADGRRPATGMALFAAALVAVSVFHVRYSWEARMYTLGTALVAFAGWALVRAVRADRPGGWWAAYTALTVLFLYTHYYAVFAVAAQGLFVATRVWADRGEPAVARRTLRGAGLSAAGIVAGYLPWVPVFLRQKAQVEGEYWTRPVGAWDVPQACYQMFCAPADGSADPEAVLAVAAACGVAVAALLWRPGPGHWLAFLSAVVPFAGSVGLSLAGTQVFTPRYFIFAHLFLIVAAAALVWRVRTPAVRWAAAGVVLLNFGVAHARFCSGLEPDRRTGPRGAAVWVTARRSPGDPVVVCSTVLYYPLRFHAGDGREAWHLYTGGTPVSHYAGGPLLTPDDIVTAGDVAATTGARVWVVQGEGGWGSTPFPIPPGWELRAECRFPGTVFHPGAVVARGYERRAD